MSLSRRDDAYETNEDAHTGLLGWFQGRSRPLLRQLQSSSVASALEPRHQTACMRPRPESEAIVTSAMHHHKRMNLVNLRRLKTRCNRDRCTMSRMGIKLLLSPSREIILARAKEMDIAGKSAAL